MWEMYFVFYSLGADGSRVMDTLINKVLGDTVDIQAGVRRVTSPRPLNISNPEELKQLIESINLQQLVRNGERLGLDLDSESVVIVIQVHQRIEELRFLIESLERARYINKCLVIFSHDMYSKDINTIINDIQAFPVLQIFYPYSIQIYPSSFPGQHPNDCPWNITLMAARKRKCNNAYNPDSYGHYREAKVAQMKHHWLWQLHYVIEEIRILKNFKGTFLRLDEDYYVAEDVIYMIQEMNKIRRSEPGKHNMMILGDYDEIPTWSYEGMSNIIRQQKWYVGVGRGMAFSKDFWQDFRSCSQVFCTYDDYNWDWALQETVLKCMTGSLNILQPSAGRVFHIGLCHGFHRNVEGCSSKNIKREVTDLLIENEEYLFPKEVSLTHNQDADFEPGHAFANGGWKDPRDHRLCKSFLGRKGLTEQTIRSINKGIRA
ncbi:alpha-1,6-mannosyl-glycoprotein 2-beta-N-acetylglucosaminyltransferase-like [Haliotis cracherodii]|uniref:alpha-1,6-mannosyl-glycoprotein 2-beta-N-acetylglucosaminyltransferase-like n=1 Tax=Haliotis cracherodii TaxID=6455 RepID=UPI0039E9D1A9